MDLRLNLFLVLLTQTLLAQFLYLLLNVVIEFLHQTFSDVGNLLLLLHQLSLLGELFRLVELVVLLCDYRVKLSRVGLLLLLIIFLFLHLKVV